MLNISLLNIIVIVYFINTKASCLAASFSAKTPLTQEVVVVAPSDLLVFEFSVPKFRLKFTPAVV